MSTATEPTLRQAAFGPSEPFTIGIEEELLLVRDGDHGLDPRVDELIAELAEPA